MYRFLITGGHKNTKPSENYLCSSMCVFGKRILRTSLSLDLLSKFNRYQIIAIASGCHQCYGCIWIPNSRQWPEMKEVRIYMYFECMHCITLLTWIWIEYTLPRRFHVSIFQKTLVFDTERFPFGMAWIHECPASFVCCAEWQQLLVTLLVHLADSLGTHCIDALCIGGRTGHNMFEILVPDFAIMVLFLHTPRYFKYSWASHIRLNCRRFFALRERSLWLFVESE